MRQIAMPFKQRDHIARCGVPYARGPRPTKAARESWHAGDAPLGLRLFAASRLPYMQMFRSVVT
jgi:hypothetical protein